VAFLENGYPITVAPPSRICTWFPFTLSLNERNPDEMIFMEVILLS